MTGSRYCLLVVPCLVLGLSAIEIVMATEHEAPRTSGVTRQVADCETRVIVENRSDTPIGGEVASQARSGRLAVQALTPVDRLQFAELIVVCNAELWLWPKSTPGARQPVQIRQAGSTGSRPGPGLRVIVSGGPDKIHIQEGQLDSQNLLPEPDPDRPSFASLSISADGYGVGVQGLLSLGLFTSLYAVELDGKLVVDWRILSTQTTIQTTPGDHRLRLLMRTVLGREPQVFDDRVISLPPDSSSAVSVNFLLGSVSIDGRRDSFNGPGMRNR